MMILLYPNEYQRVADLLRTVPINTFFARAVVEGHVGGRVYVDEPDHPRTAYVAHPYGMSLLFGEAGSERFDERLKAFLLGEVPSRTACEWLQVYPDVWSAKLEALLGSRLVRIGDAGAVESAEPGLVLQDVRVNFRFDAQRYAKLRRALTLPPECRIVDDLEYIYSTMQGSVVPHAFWDTPDEFERRGVAFAVRWRGELASTAFASFVMDGALELGIETHERFRGQGLAVHACSALIDYCLDRELEPVWACRLSNQGSYRLAQKLGFEHSRSLPYYRLPESPRHAGLAEAVAGQSSDGRAPLQPVA
jgi:RimJ/RimL family protein N-acetyltransferase